MSAAQINAAVAPGAKAGASGIKAGVATGDELQAIFDLAKAKQFALPAVNVINTSTVNAVMETASEIKSPAIIQFSNGGAQFFAGKGLDNANQRSCIAGGISGAHHIHQLAELYGATIVLHTDHAAKKLLPWIDGLLDAGEQYFKVHGKPLFSSHMLDLSEEPLHENIDICKRYLERMSKMGMTLEIELGVTGGEEDGVDNTGVDSSKLYTQPEDVALAYEQLSKVSDRFTIAAAFGNVHGVYKPGNVKLQPIILKNSQDFVQKKFGTKKTAGQLRFPRRIRIDSRGNPRGNLLWRGQDEHRYRPAVGLLGWRDGLLQEKRGLSPGSDW
jgi:fructose-bisphosphate aldolase class II